MAQTPNSVLTAYVSPINFFTFVEPAIMADLLSSGRGGSPRPSFLAMVDPLNPYGVRVNQFLLYGAGEIESACLVAKRYSPDDLQTLLAQGGASGTLIMGLNSVRALWRAYQRLKPGAARFEDVPGARESAEMLKMLQNGDRIFSFYESQEAGLPSAHPPQPQQLITGDVVARARRLFPGYGPNRIWPGGPGN